MKDKLKKYVDRFKRFDIQEKFLCVLTVLALVIAIAFLMVWFKDFFTTLLVVFGLWVASRMESGKPIFPKKSVNYFDYNFCRKQMGELAFEVIKKKKKLLNINMPSTRERIEIDILESPDNLPRYGFQVPVIYGKDRLDEDTIRSILQQSFSEQFSSRKNMFWGTGVTDIYLDDIKQTGTSLTLTLMPLCAGITDSYIQQERMRASIKRQRERQEQEIHLYDDTL